MPTNWKIYVHGCIDGYSHLIIYCKATGRNTSEAVKPIFMEACEQLGAYPFHLRTDRGWENRGMWEVMLDQRADYITKCAFVGPSTRKTRIERLWRTYNCSKMMKYRRMFRSMEQNNGLDRHNQVHIWCLHYIFIPRLNRELQAWVQSQNNKAHPGDPVQQLRRTPEQRFVEGLQRVYSDEFRTQMLERETTNLNLEEDLAAQDNGYGAGYERESRWVERDDPHAQAWPMAQRPPITNAQYQFIEQNIDPLMEDNAEGVALWMTLVNMVEQFLG